ncbi:MAG TPA: phosphoribosyltransferase family protein [Flavisolibacter sp.]|jgi:predicted phosphoribosyltransferase|nr:phosphoribosyltransferase family protein [Flavisolibacter sp.]
MYRFHNRNEAGKHLAIQLRKFSGQSGVVLAVPRGGVPVAYEIARELQWPLDVLLVKKLGHPLNKEYAIGAVGITDIYLSSHEKIDDQYLKHQIKNVRRQLFEWQHLLKGDTVSIDRKGRTVILVDDGAATGSTLLASVRILKKEEPAKIILAVPVITVKALQLLAPEVDEVIAILIPDFIPGIGSCYHDFSQVSVEEIQDFLEKYRSFKKAV